VRFADYGFNRSHAVAYSMIAYQLAYLKAHYPAFFISSLLTSVVGNETKVAQYIREAKLYDLEILPPSINTSQFVFTVEGKNRIRYSLGAIKGIGAAALKEIIRARKEKPFQDLFDFCMRVSSKTINRKILENLVLAGAFDEFEVDRATLLASLDVAAQHAELVNPEDDPDLFHEEEAFMLKPKYVEVEDMTIDTKLQFEKQVLGLYLSDHPVSSYRPLFQELGLQQIADLQKGSKITLGGYITGVKSIRTKKGEVMAFLEIGDESGEMEAVVFPNVYRNNIPHLKEGNILLFGGNVEDRNDKLQFIVSQLETMEDVRARVKESGQKLYLKIAVDQDEVACMDRIHQTIKRFKGKNPVIVYYENAKKSVRLPDHLRISPSQEALRELNRILGEANVILQ
jgi:DNA polymerase III subunit alpha